MERSNHAEDGLRADAAVGRPAVDASADAHPFVDDVRRRLTRAERDLSDGFRRWRLWVITNPVRGGMDVVAAVLAICGALWLVLRTVGPVDRQIAVAVYGLSLVGVFTVSALYHSVPWRPELKAFMQRLDHSMIYVLVAGTYTPVAVFVLDGAVRVVTLGVVWGIAMVGLVQKWFVRHVGHWLSFSLQITQGWLAGLLLIPLMRELPGRAVLLIVIGGLLYTTGLVLLITRRPYLWPRVFSYHEVMHVCVIAAAACHFATIALYVSPRAG